MTETVRCITCQHFTLRPRAADGRNESMREMDRKYITMGMGRCAHTRESYIWHSGECPRTCTRYAPIGADQAQARRDLVAKRRA
jgi:hypothetical protein